MHGSICVILKKFVEQSHGKETWQEILRLAGHDGLVLSPIQSYPDEAVFAIVGATCEHLEVDMQTGLEAVGKFAAPELVRSRRGMLHLDWKTFELLANIETLIHRTIRVSNPDAEPQPSKLLNFLMMRFRLSFFTAATCTGQWDSSGAGRCLR